MGGQVRNARIWQIEATGAWWYANQVILQDGELPQIKNVVVAPGAGLIHADALTWENEGWYLEGPITRWTVDGERRDQWQRHDRLPCSGDLALPLSVQQLTQRLVSRHALSGGELLQRGGQLNLALLSDRYGRLLVPLAMVLMVLPLFAQFAHRDQLLVSAARAVILSLLPLLIVATAGMTADSAVMHPFIIMSIALLLALAPGLVLYTRWRL